MPSCTWGAHARGLMASIVCFWGACLRASTVHAFEGCMWVCQRRWWHMFDVCAQGHRWHQLCAFEGHVRGHILRVSRVSRHPSHDFQKFYNDPSRGTNLPSWYGQFRCQNPLAPSAPPQSLQIHNLIHNHMGGLMDLWLIIISKMSFHVFMKTAVNGEIIWGHTQAVGSSNQRWLRWDSLSNEKETQKLVCMSA